MSDTSHIAPEAESIPAARLSMADLNDLTRRFPSGRVGAETTASIHELRRLTYDLAARYAELPASRERSLALAALEQGFIWAREALVRDRAVLHGCAAPASTPI
jgi:hypothetical protein